MTFLVSDAILGLSLTKFLLHLLNFAILFTCLWLILYKPVMKFIRARQERIDNQKKEAEENLKASEEARLASEERLRTIDEEIAEKKAMANRTLEEECDRKVKAAEERAEEILRHAEAEAASEREKAVAGAKKEIKDIAVTLAERVIEREIDDVDDRLIDDALEEWRHE